jgi:hypothetical protein
MSCQYVYEFRFPGSCSFFGQSDPYSNGRSRTVANNELISRYSENGASRNNVNTSYQQSSSSLHQARIIKTGIVTTKNSQLGSLLHKSS